MNDEELVSLVWSEVSHGRQLVQELEQRVCQAAPGSLSMHGCCDRGLTRADLIHDAAAIVNTFSNLIFMLNSIPAGSQPQAAEECGEVELQRTYDSSSPISLIRDSPSPQQAKETMQQSSSFFCAKASPQSPRSISTTSSAKRSIDQARSLDSYHTTGLQQFHPAVYQEASQDVEEKFDLPENSVEALSNLEEESGSRPQTSLSKKRKCLPKRTLKLPASNTEQGHEAAAPADGWTWRKYGQKDILGSHHPRSYYRCTLKAQLGCPAVRYVQKSDDDPSLFHVIYKGEHICRLKNPLRLQLHPPSPLPIASFQDPKSNFHRNSSCLTLNTQMDQTGPTTKDFQLPMLKNPSEKTLTNDVIYRPLPRFQLSELARTLKLEQDNAHPNPKNLTATTDLGANDKILSMNGFHLTNQAQIFQINEIPKLNLGEFGSTEADQSLHKIARRDTSQAAFRQILKQLPDPLFLDEEEGYGYETCTHPTMPTMFELSELFSADNSGLEAASNSAPLDSLSNPESEFSLGAIAAKGQPPSSDQSETSEVVAENIPNFEFDLDFMLACPDSQPMKDWQ